jgi:aspartyl-tRNA(Asn)/glutamyl-tRNA(Gln) amidotransferase subunit A
MSKFLDDFPTIAAYRAGLDQGQFSVMQATDALLTDIQTHQVLNAFVDVDAKLSQTQATWAQAQLALAQPHALTGVPLAHKDIFVSTESGWRCQSG